ncbi:RING-H2 finger protein ATL2-like [Zingiber officinale]|uniref:RING-type E3 ubiquitin transferase n=1 Tax=Zingiber officinale TaxID=94328 RepID=A0A8J5IFA8_ZINOF|nr:RING-H2 finger protein ATL2-like [Zingiber officinale]KAG6533926.1 hypothetical protein ZIOFF_007804 [Zingiber officinale]
MDTNIVGDQIPSPRGYALSGKVMLISTVVLFGAVLLLLALHLYLRSRFLLLRQRHRRIRRRLVLAHDGAGRAFPAAPSSRGLDPSVVKSLPLRISAGSEEEAEDCAVCLSNFEEGEKMRVLPRCAHRFHIDCIDMWFHSHSSCPLCRSTVEAHPVMPPALSPPEPDRPSSAGLCPGSWRGVGMGSPGSASREIRIDVPERGLEEDELGLGLKSPGSRMILLVKFLNRDSRFFRSGGTTEESSELENGEGPASHPPRPPPSSAQ